MPQISLESNQMLDNFVLNYELSKHCKIAPTAYKFWQKTISAHFSGARAVFLLKSSIPPKYQEQIQECSNLSGVVLSSAFCAFSGLASSHLTRSNCSRLNELLKIHKIGPFKFVDLRHFLNSLGLENDAKIYIEKCKFFSPAPLEKCIKLTPTLCLGYY